MHAADCTYFDRHALLSSKGLSTASPAEIHRMRLL